MPQIHLLDRPASTGTLLASGDNSEEKYWPDKEDRVLEGTLRKMLKSTNSTKLN